MYAGVCETDITPPNGAEMCGHGAVRVCTAIHDPLYGRALVLENGRERIALIVADLRGVPVAEAYDIRAAVARQIGSRAEAVLLSCTGTHGGPAIAMEPSDQAYVDVRRRKLIGAAVQAAADLEPVNLTFGETSAQIGISSRQAMADGRVIQGKAYAGTVAPAVQSLCVNASDGRLMAVLFSHACQAAAIGGDNRDITADWPGAAVEHLKLRFRKECLEGGVRENALPLFLQGCSADVSPVRGGSWEAVRENGRQIAEAAHAARWNAHGRQQDTLSAREITLELGDASSGKGTPFTIGHVRIGGIHLLSFPAEMFVRFQLDFATQSQSPVICVCPANGNLGCIPTAAESDRGGFDLLSTGWTAGLPAYNSAAESLIRSAVYDLLEIAEPEKALYPLVAGAQHPGR